jgi:integrase
MALSKLTNIVIKAAKPSDKDYKLSDGGGLHLLIKKNGTKCWRYSYRYAGKQKTLALGVYPETSLKAARITHTQAKALLANGGDPSLDKKQKRQQVMVDQSSLFSTLAREWWDNQRGTWTSDHADRVLRRLDADVLPYLGGRLITEIRPPDVIEVIRRIENRGALDVAQRVLQDIGRIGRYAVQIGYATVNPAGDLSGIVKSRKTSHRASLPQNELPDFLRLLEDYDSKGRLLTKLAMKLLVLTFVRSGELRGANWSEFNLADKIWRIPAARMKMKTEHLVPLSDQALEVIQEIRSITSQYSLVFPSERHRHEPMSDNTMRKAIFNMGYDGNTSGKSKAVPHGFRATASSILNEQGFNPDAIERQLAHMERNSVRAAYTHHARYLDERAEMMQWWADYIDQMKAGSNDVSGSFGINE